MPYSVRKQSCKQASGKKGSYVLSYTDKKGEKHRNCHTSEKKARGQVSAIEMGKHECGYRESSERVEEIYEAIIERLHEMATLEEE